MDKTQKELADIQINLSTAEDQIDSLKEENERIKKELTYFKEGAEYQLGVEHGCDSLKQINSELVKMLSRITLSMKVHPDCTEGSEFGDYVSLSEKLLNRAKKTQP